MNNDKPNFGTDGIRGTVGEDITEQLMYRLGQCADAYVSNAPIVVAWDTRESGPALAQAFAAGAASNGTAVWLIGCVPSGLVSELCNKVPEIQLGVVITASHNYAKDNGIKFYAADGFKLQASAEAELLDHWHNSTTTARQKVSRWDHTKNTLDKAIWARDFLVNAIVSEANLSLDNLPLSLRCNNGATSGWASEIFEKLGAKVQVYDAQPDGRNINRPSSEMRQNNTYQLQFDGDGDRLDAMTPQGAELTGDTLLYLCVASRNTQNTQNPNNKAQTTEGVVGTILTNEGLGVSLSQQFNIQLARAQVGEVDICRLLKKHQWTLGGEPTGHLLDLNRMTSSDGIINGIEFMCQVQQFDGDLTAVLKNLVMWPATLTSVSVVDKQKIMSDEKLQTVLYNMRTEHQKQARIEMYPSGTEPVIRVFAESQDRRLQKQLVTDIVAAVQETAESIDAS